MKTFKNKKMTCNLDFKSVESLDNKKLRLQKCKKVQEDNQMIVAFTAHKTKVAKINIPLTKTMSRFKNLSNLLTQSKKDKALETN